LTIISTELYHPGHLDRSERSERSGENQERDFSVSALPPVEMTGAEREVEMTEADRTVSSTTRVISTGVAQPRSGEI